MLKTDIYVYIPEMRLRLARARLSVHPILRYVYINIIFIWTFELQLANPRVINERFHLIVTVEPLVLRHTVISVFQSKWGR